MTRETGVREEDREKGVRETFRLREREREFEFLPFFFSLTSFNQEWNTNQFNPSSAVATFVLSTKMQGFLISI